MWKLFLKIIVDVISTVFHSNIAECNGRVLCQITVLNVVKTHKSENSWETKALPVYLSYGTKMSLHMSFDPRANPTCESQHLVYACPHQFPKPNGSRALEIRQKLHTPLVPIKKVTIRRNLFFMRFPFIKFALYAI